MDDNPYDLSRRSAPPSPAKAASTKKGQKAPPITDASVESDEVDYGVLGPVPVPPVEPVALSAEMKRALVGYIQVPKVQWTKLRAGEHIKYMRTNGSLRVGGFVKGIRRDAEGKIVIQLINKTGEPESADGNTSWAVRFENIRAIWKHSGVGVIEAPAVAPEEAKKPDESRPVAAERAYDEKMSQLVADQQARLTDVTRAVDVLRNRVDDQVREIAKLRELIDQIVLVIQRDREARKR